MGTTGLDILVVDAGNGTFASPLANLLRTSGFRAKCIPNVPDAGRDLFGWCNYNALVVDLDLPGARELVEKAEKTFPDLKIIFLPVDFQELKSQLAGGVCS